MSANLGRAHRALRRRQEQGLLAFGEAVVGRAKEPDETPVLTGTLRNTLHVEGPQRDSRGVSIDIAAGGPSAPYAIKVHEDLNQQHPRGGKAKYLEDPLNELAPEALDIIGDYVNLRD